ncbi:hypothetical protein N7519_002880 [Penicillium mononematosum]|uniref:uncharacterized protein n=1 Tax=Penicillium mononematosum TaxID=268346 RepID=UPI00254763C2|nr:uncharacterized protein N7519_002880 [Penicillium mononematosum]KAJ6187972.1 hypothetical protein N7519_002880 [Penicillium mononematosum]
MPCWTYLSLGTRLGSLKVAQDSSYEATGSRYVVYFGQGLQITAKPFEEKLSKRHDKISIRLLWRF